MSKFGPYNKVRPRRANRLRRANRKATKKGNTEGPEYDVPRLVRGSPTAVSTVTFNAGLDS